MISEFELPDEDIDWDVVKSRLKEQHAVVRSKELSPEDTDALLEERALARVPDATPDAGSLLEVMTIRRGDERFAIETRFVREVIPGPTDPANFEKVSGRGLILVNAFMSESFHNEKGNEITMIKRRE